MGRLLAIDYGRKRSGLAVSDPLKIIAGGLATVATAQLLNFLKDYASKEPLETIVIGEPRQMDGSPSETMNGVLALASRLRKCFPSVGIEMFDERFTSVLAHRAMLDGGLRKQARQNKALVDEISATIILQGFMEAERNSRKR